MESQTLKLIYPQWQGGNIAEWFKDIPDNDISKGYALGAKLLEILTSNASYQTCEIPISMDFKRVVKDGNFRERGDSQTNTICNTIYHRSKSH